MQDSDSTKDNSSLIAFPKFDKLRSKSPIHYYVGVLEYEHELVGDQPLYAALLIHCLDNLLACSEDEVMNKLEGCIMADSNFRWLVGNDYFEFSVKAAYSVQSQKELEALKMMHHYHVDHFAYDFL